MPEHQALESRISNSPFKVLAIRNPKVVEKIIEGRITPASECYSEELNDPVFLRAQNVEEGYLNFSDAKRLSEEAFEAEPKAVLADGDLVLTIDGVLLGIAAIHRAGDQECCISNHMVRLRHGVEANPEFLAWLLNSSLGQKQIKRGISGSAIPGIRTDAIERILIPLPSTEIQRSLVADIEAARQSRKQKLSQADELLSSLDAYLLDQLGLSAPEESDRKVFSTRLHDIKTRFDVGYHTLRFQNLRRMIEDSSAYRVMTIGEICQTAPRSGFAAGRQNQAFNEEEGLPHVRPLNIKPFGEITFEGTKYVPLESVRDDDLLIDNEVLFNNTNSMEWVGKSAVFTGDRKCACSNHITRLLLKRDIAEPFFVATLFNALRSLGFLGLLSTNFNNQAGINTETLSSLHIPVPTLMDQRTIVFEVQERRSNAQRLRQEAETEWEAAKTRFERQLLGEEA